VEAFATNEGRKKKGDSPKAGKATSSGKKKRGCRTLPAKVKREKKAVHTITP